MKRFKQNLRTFAILVLTAIVTTATAADRFVFFDGGDLLINDGNTLAIYLDGNDCKGVSIAAENLCRDMKLVTGMTNVQLTDNSGAKIVVGTIGHSEAIDALAKKGGIDAKALQGKREKFIITTVGNQLVIAGSDRRGTIYGIYELSKQIGVSPWYYWADTPLEHHSNIYVNKGVYTDGEPAVKYRGIFLNDEAPCLSTWVKNTFGTNYGDHRFYAKVFELILRLKGNMMWPAMWSWSFYADDSLNSKTADKMGVIMGTSHHEPMARNHQEWARNRRQYGAWNYDTNRDVLKDFFRKGIERMKETEDIVTIGMRGDGDEPMSKDTDTKLLEKIVADQRQIITEVTGKKASETPQVWALYKEVMDYYDKGMRVPDDVIMLLCDDNWGDVRRVPNLKERQHKGGWGLYYHVDYVGAPRNSKFLNVTPTQNMWEQLTLAYDSGIQSLWVLNVGDLKPMEYPIQLFMDMAWAPHEYNVDNITDHTLTFCRQQFGEKEANEASRILNLCCKYNGRSTAEMLNADTYDLESGEWYKVLDQYDALEKDAVKQYEGLPTAYKDTYKQIILFPIQAMANLHHMYFAQAMNSQAAKSNARLANYWADKCVNAFHRDSLLCADYNSSIAGGKWKGMMIQKHIGYTSWDDNFRRDTCPKLVRMEDNDMIDIEAVDFIKPDAADARRSKNAEKARWTIIPYMGKSVGAVTLMPYTTGVKDSKLVYRFKGKAGKARVHVVTKSTLDYLNKGGMTYKVAVDGASPVTINFNSNLNENKENIYSIYYPTVVTRVIDKYIEVEIPESADGMHYITIMPDDPAIVFEKIIVDYTNGARRVSHL